MKILLVDDDPDIIKSLSSVLEEYEIIDAASIKESIKKLGVEEDVDLAIIDVKLGNEDGLELLKWIRLSRPSIECIMISGYSTIEKAVLSIKLGAYEFIEKPITYQKIKVLIKNAMSHKQYTRLKEKEIDRYKLIGVSEKIKNVMELIDKAAVTDFPVLISGASGSGKEHAAHLIHLKSKRAQYEMIKLNCASIPKDLFESELFGHVKGAFTGAISDRKGKIELANKGTLFLDEIGEMPVSYQAKLLRALEDKEISRLGSENKKIMDFRLITASNRDLTKEVADGNFREDFYYRIGVIFIDIPPLRERSEDIPILSKHFLKRISADEGTLEKTLSSKALQKLTLLPLKGNVRELKNIIQRLYIYTDKDEIIDRDIDKIAGDSPIGKNESLFNKTMPFSAAKLLMEKTYIQNQLKLHDNNISKTAISLNMLPNNLVRKMRSLGL